MTNVLKNSLTILYQDSPEILEILEQIDYTQLNVKWKEELYSRISQQEYFLVENFLASALYKRYTVAIQEATMSMTRPLSALMTFVMIQDEKGEKH